MSETNIFGSFFDNYYKAAKSETDFADMFIKADERRRFQDRSDQQQFNNNMSTDMLSDEYFKSKAPMNALKLEQLYAVQPGMLDKADMFSKVNRGVNNPQNVQLTVDGLNSTLAASSLLNNDYKNALYNMPRDQREQAVIGKFLQNQQASQIASLGMGDSQNARARYAASGSTLNFENWQALDNTKASTDRSLYSYNELKPKETRSPLSVEFENNATLFKSIIDGGGNVPPAFVQAQSKLAERIFAEQSSASKGGAAAVTPEAATPAAAKAAAPAVNPLAKQLAAPLTSQDVQDIDKWMKPEYLAMSKSVKDAETELRIAMGNGTVEQQRQALTKVQVRKENFNGMLSTVPTNAANSIRTRLGF